MNTDATKSKQFYETIDRERLYSYENDPKKHTFYKQLRDFIERWDLNEKSCLEIGSGKGIFQDVVKDYTGVDIAANLSKYYHKPYFAVSGAKLPFPDSSFDAIFSYATHEHIPDLETAMNEIIRVLKPGGVCLLAPAWHTRTWFAKGYQVRPYGDLSLKEKFIKFTIPIRDSIFIRWPFVFLRRLIRMIYYICSPVSRLRFKKLNANYEKFWQSDSDACNSIDPFDLIMWFRGRNIICHGYNSLWCALFVRTYAIELQKQSKLTAQNKRLAVLMLASGHRYNKTNGINVGDIAQLEHALYLIRTHYPGAKITLAAHSLNDECSVANVRYSRRLVNYLIIPSNSIFLKATMLLFKSFVLLFLAKFLRLSRMILSADNSALKALNEFLETDVLILSGAGIFNDRYMKGPAFIWCIAILCASTLGVPVILLGQQIGPLLNWLPRFVLGMALKKAAFVGVRDEVSGDVAFSLGVAKNKIRFTGDEGAYLAPENTETIEAYFREKNIKQPFIAVQFRIDSNCPMLQYVSWFANVLNTLAARYGAMIVFVPFWYADKGDDREACRLVASKLLVPYEILDMDINGCSALTKGVIAGAKMAIGVANHFCVFSASVGVPTIGLYATPYMAQKLQGVQKVAPNVIALSITDAKASDEIVNLAIADLLARSKNGGTVIDIKKPSGYFDWLDVVKIK